MVVYLLLRTETRIAVRFVAAKTRVPPLRSQTIPLLELLSALLLSRLVVSIHTSIQTNLDVKCYTDSQVALYWIRGKEKEWKPNRVRDMAQCSPRSLEPPYK